MPVVRPWLVVNGERPCLEKCVVLSAMPSDAIKQLGEAIKLAEVANIERLPGRPSSGPCVGGQRPARQQQYRMRLAAQMSEEEYEQYLDRRIARKRRPTSG